MVIIINTKIDKGCNILRNFSIFYVTQYTQGTPVIVGRVGWDDGIRPKQGGKRNKPHTL